MIQVLIDGQPLQASIAGINAMPDLVEFIKANIDPEKIITGLTIAGRPLADVDWRVPLTVQGPVVVEASTDLQRNFIADRLDQASGIVEIVVSQFTLARESFQAGKTEDGNRQLSKATTDLGAFLGWYEGILQLLPTDWQSELTAFHAQIKEISKTCEQLLQQQLYHSWWALGETVRQDLEPKLESLKGSCDQVSSTWIQAQIPG